MMQENMAKSDEPPTHAPQKVYCVYTYKKNRVSRSIYFYG